MGLTCYAIAAQESAHGARQCALVRVAEPISVL